MKHGLRVANALIAFAIMGTVMTTARAQGSAVSVSFRVERGDTYTNLFGQDWEKAYGQNHVTVIRGGGPVTSPDILIEGSVITVTGDVQLSPRASVRLVALNRRRAELQVRLTALASKLAPVSEAQKAAEECRKLLESDRSFAADMEFAAGEVAHLERLAQNAIIPAAPPQSVSLWWIALPAFGTIALAAAILWKRQRSTYPEGAARCRHAFADIRTAFKATGVDL